MDPLVAVLFISLLFILQVSVGYLLYLGYPVSGPVSHYCCIVEVF